MSTATYEEEAEFLLQSLVDDPCECGRGPEGHIIAPDARGRHAHAYCRHPTSSTTAVAPPAAASPP